MNFDETMFDGPSEDAGFAELPQGPTYAERGDAFEQWLRAKRDDYLQAGVAWNVIDEVLGDYLIHADHGVPLGEPTPDKRVLFYSELSGGAA